MRGFDFSCCHLIHEREILLDHRLWALTTLEAQTQDLPWNLGGTLRLGVWEFKLFHLH